MEINVPPLLHQMQMKGAMAQLNPNLAFTFYYVFKTVPMIVAGIAIYLGYRLFILGVTGQASLSIQTRDVTGQLINAAPGLFFAVGGIVAMIVTVWKGVHVSFDGNRADFICGPGSQEGGQAS